MKPRRRRNESRITSVTAQISTVLHVKPLHFPRCRGDHHQSSLSSVSDAQTFNVLALGSEIDFPERANRRAWKRAVRCSIVKNGTINTGMSTKGNRVIGLVVTFPISPLMPGKAPEDRVAIDTATTKSAIPTTFQTTNRRLAANDGLRIRLSTIHGALIPIAMSPSPAGKANSPGKTPFA